jgi:hypothetical protein
MTTRPLTLSSYGFLPFSFHGLLIIFITLGSEFFDGQENPKDRTALSMEGAAPELNPSMVVVNYLFDNPETQTVPLRFAALEGIK